MTDAAHRAAVCPRIAYMPQGLGKNLYPDLSVRENIEFFGRVFGQSRAEREWRIAELLHSTSLAPFADRPAKKLSGGMRQKLGLCCSLIHDPDLLILDEPTTGVDPLSRRQFWELIERMRVAPRGHERRGRDRLHGRGRAVRFAHCHERGKNPGGRLADGSQDETHATTVEDAFIALLPERTSRRAQTAGNTAAPHRRVPSRSSRRATSPAASAISPPSIG